MELDKINNIQEWEWLVSPQEFIKGSLKGVFECKDLFDGRDQEIKDMQTLIIERTEDYDIVGICNKAILERSECGWETDAGAEIKYGIIKYEDSFQEIVVDPCYIIKTEKKNFLSPDQEAIVTVRALEVKHKIKDLSDLEEDRIVEWYINAPSNLFLIFSDKESYEEKIDISIKRGNASEIEIGKAVEYHSSCLQIKYNDNGFLLWTPSKLKEGKKDGNFAIEYRKEFGEIPNEEERDSIAELISFLFGRHLIKVGETSFLGGTKKEAMSRYLRTTNVSLECKSNTRPTIWDGEEDRKHFKSSLEKLLPVYLEKRKEYKLDLALNRYWTANYLPMGICLPIISSGLESIMNGWFKSQKSESKGAYLPKDEYEKVIEPLLEDLKETLDENQFIDRIVNKIEKAYLMGANEKFEVFFGEIELPYGERERECIKKRNAFTHGSKGTDDLEIYKNTNTFFILFTRVLLILLGYEEEYIDYTIIGFPKKKVKEPIG